LRSERRWPGLPVDSATLRVGLRANPQDHDRNHLVARLACVVLDSGENLPDDSVAVAAGVHGVAAFPFTFKGIAHVGRGLQDVEEASRPLDSLMSFWITTFQTLKIVSRLSC
jgi:hypothetical protein